MVAKATRALILAAVLALVGRAAPAAQSGLTVTGQCVGDANGDSKVSVDELVAAVDNALNGCPSMAVTLQFKGMVGDQPFVCGQHYTGIGTANSEIIPSDFRVYLHDIRLVNDSGDDVPLKLDQDEVWQLDDLVLLDFEDRTSVCVLGTAGTNTVVRGTVPPGDYRGVRFRIGVPFELNHKDMATGPCPLCLTGMFWSWQGGYKFMRVDTSADNLRIHLGSTGCVYGSPGVIDHCDRPNRGEVFLDGFDPQHDVIIADLAAVVADSDLSNNQGPSPGCMSDQDDPDCAPIFKNLGIDFETGLPDASTQTFFRVE